MKALINYFVDLCLLRAKPQDLAASQALFWLAMICNVVVGLMLIGDSAPNPTMALFESTLNVALMLATLWLMLHLRNLPARFLQSATALMGSDTLMGLTALPLMVLNGSGDANLLANLAGFLLLIVMFWSLAVIGHILRHAFSLPLALAIGFGLLYTLFSNAVLTKLFQVS